MCDHFWLVEAGFDHGRKIRGVLLRVLDLDVGRSHSLELLNVRTGTSEFRPLWVNLGPF